MLVVETEIVKPNEKHLPKRNPDNTMKSDQKGAIIDMTPKSKQSSPVSRLTEQNQSKLEKQIKDSEKKSAQ